MPLDRDLDALADDLLKKHLDPEMPADAGLLADDDADDITTAEDGKDAFDEDAQ